MTTPAADVEVWLVDLVRCRDALLGEEQVRPRLPAGHALAAGSARHLAHIALRITLERYIGVGARRVPFEVLPGGRPELPAGADGRRPASFSLSHTEAAAGSVALVAVAGRGPLGVDIERPRDLRMDASHRAAICRAANAIAANERWLDAGAADTLAAWTRLEALAKADGCGMARLLSHLGARGHGDLDDGELAARAGGWLDRLGVVVADLDAAGAGTGFAAAIAYPRGLRVRIAAFPAIPAGLAALAAAAR